MANKSLTDSPWFWLAATAASAGVVYVAYKAGKKIVSDVRKKDVANDVDRSGTSKAVAAVNAQRLYAAFFRSGQTFFPDGTNLEPIYLVAQDLAKGNTTWQDLTAAYKKTWNRDLTADLNDELDSDELDRFWYTAGKRSTNGLNGLI